MKNKLFHITHNDGDAIGCALLVALFYNEFHVADNTYFCNVSDASNVLNEILDTNDFISGDVIIISDISVSEATCERLEALRLSGVIVLGFDHHKTNTLNKKYDWFKVSDKESYDILLGKPVPESACKFMLDTFKCVDESFLSRNKSKLFNKPNNDKFDDNVTKIICSISRYDTWVWKTHDFVNTTYDGFIIGVDDDIINLCCKFLGPKICFMNLLLHIEFFNSSRDLLPLKFYDIYAALKDKEKKSLEHIVEKTKCVCIGGIDTVIFISNDDFSNANCEYLYNLMDEIELVCCLYPTTNTVSFRTKKDYIDVSRLAKVLGGGGHKAAAGAKLSDDLYLQLLIIYYKHAEPLSNYIKE